MQNNPMWGRIMINVILPQHKEGETGLWVCANKIYHVRCHWLFSVADSSHRREVERSRKIPAHYQWCGRPLLRKMLGYPGAGGDLQQQQHVVCHRKCYFHIFGKGGGLSFTHEHTLLLLLFQWSLDTCTSSSSTREMRRCNTWNKNKFNVATQLLLSP